MKTITNYFKRRGISGPSGLLFLGLLLSTFALRAQQRTWMLPYYQHQGATTSTGGVITVPIIDFTSGTPLYTTHGINGSFSTQAVGNGEYCNNAAADQVTKLSNFFISGRAADVYQANANGTNPLRTVYTNWEQIGTGTIQNGAFLTTGGVDLAHESLNEVAVGDGETPGTFWVVMQESPANNDGFGPGFYVYLMDMNNSTLTSSTILQISNSTFATQIPAGTTFGEGVALGPKFQYVTDAGETNTALINLNGQFCRSIYIATYSVLNTGFHRTTVYHFLINLANSTLVYSDQVTPISFASQNNGNMFMEIDLNFPQNGDHPDQLGMTGWGGVYMLDLSTTTGKMATGAATTISTATGGYGLEFDHMNNYMYYSLQGASAAPTLHRYDLALNVSAQITTTGLSSTASYNNLCLESAIDGNIYGLTTNQELISIINPELNSTTSATVTQLTAASFDDPNTTQNDLNPNNNTNFKFGLSLPDWVDGEVPLTSGGGTIAVKLPCALCDDAQVQHTVDIYATDNNGNTSLLQHFDVFPCEEVRLNVCPGIIYEVVFDDGLPTEQNQLVQISFAGQVQNVTFSLPNASSNYISYNTNTTISTNTLWDNKVYIGDNVIVTVDAGATLDITNVDILFGSDAGIDFKDGALLRANNSVFRPCDINDVWRGLAFFTSNGTPPSGMINECTFKNAKSAVEGLGTSSSNKMSLDLRITNNLFADCQRGVSFNYINFLSSISGNTYMIENIALPFASINTSSPNPPKTTTLGCSYLGGVQTPSQNDFFGISATYTRFQDLIGQNDFIMNSSQTAPSDPGDLDQMSYGISMKYCTNPFITSNKITDFSYGINLNSTDTISIEQNTLEWTNLYKKVLSNEYKYHISVYDGSNVLIKSNKIYSANLLNTNPGTSVPEGGAGGPNTPSYKTIGISCVYPNNVVIKQNEIIGIESGISAIGKLNSKNLYIAENEIKKSWYYGIYLRSYENTDVSCNVIDMELKTTRDATGIGIFNTIANVNPANFAIRGNCVLNSKNAIYAYDLYNATWPVSPIPKIYNNYCYNYTRVGFENNGFTSSAIATPYDVHRNTLISNSSLTGVPDVLTSLALTVDYNYGIQNTSGPVTLSMNNAGNSTASCAAQANTFANSLTGLQSCDYYYPTPAAWNPNGKVIDWTYTMPDTTSLNETFELLDPIYTDIGEVIHVTDKLFDVYPVPSNDVITVSYNLESAENAYFEIIDVQGRILKTQPVLFDRTSVDVNISDLSQGAYIIRLINADKPVYNSKLIKQ